MAKLVNSPTRVLLIGPLPPPLGGTRISFKLLVDSLVKSGQLNVQVLAMPHFRGNPVSAIFHLTHLWIKILRYIGRVDIVSLHCNTSALHIVGLLVILTASVFRKPVMLRTFGGDDFRQLRGRIARRIAAWVVNHTNLYLAQTKELVHLALKDSISQVTWFPTNRPMTKEDPIKKKQCRQFIYLGHVRREKGVEEILEAGKYFNETDVRIDVYGPLRHDIKETTIQDHVNISYCGVVEPEQVENTLARYDALLLPSYFSGEGYPGVIIEAFSLGLPVICTRWRSLPELVDDTCGILVRPGDSKDLFQAMNSLVMDDELFARLQEGVKTKRLFFSTEYWIDTFTLYCQILAGKSSESISPFGDSVVKESM
jgi:glycosyltransferase involved in cell wall biosynthesis